MPSDPMGFTPRRWSGALLAAVLPFTTMPAAQVEPAATWTRVVSANFEVIGEVEAARLREVALRLERFRAAFRQAYPRAHVVGPTPVVVYVFASQRTAEGFRPMFEGRPVDVGGTFSSGPDLSVITLTLDGGDRASPVLYHEVTHFIVEQSLAAVPVWFNEGLAEYHSTFDLIDGGARASIGRAHGDHLRRLRRESWLPLIDVLSVTRDSPLYNEGDRRTMFYAQAWLLVHYLLLGNPERTPHLFDYLDAVNAGRTPEDAFREAFPVTPALLERELAEYAKRQTFPTTLVTLHDVGGADGASLVSGPETMREADVEAALGDLLLRRSRGAEARSRLERAIVLDAHHARALSALGVLARQEGEEASAVDLNRRAAAMAPDDALVQLRLALSLAASVQASDLTASDRRGRLEDLLVSTQRVLARRPNTAEAHALSGFAGAALARERGERVPAPAIDAVRRAVSLAPARDRYRLLLADLLIAAGDARAARQVLAPLANRADDTTRAEVRRLLDQLTRARPDSAVVSRP